MAPGIFCFSVDGIDSTLSVETVHRGEELAGLMEQFAVRANWTRTGDGAINLPPGSETTVEMPKASSRKQYIGHLRQMSATLLRAGHSLSSLVLDPHEARANWDLLVRHGASVTRPRTAGVTSETTPRIVRGGLWIVPLTCQFVGGSRRSVRGLLRTCQRRLLETAVNGGLFHLNVDVANQRDSWAQEMDAIQSLLEIVSKYEKQDSLRSATFCELPAILTRKSEQPMLSILKRAA